jgi:hypothetical protein
MFKKTLCTLIILLTAGLGCNSSKRPDMMRDILVGQITPGYRSYLNSYVSAEYSHQFDDMIGIGLKPNPWYVKDPENPTIISNESGTAIYKGRELQAGIIQANIEMLDRIAGIKKINFLAIAAINDPEFDMVRDVLVCDDRTNAAQSLSKWKVEHTFKPDHRFWLFWKR